MIGPEPVPTAVVGVTARTKPWSLLLSAWLLFPQKARNSCAARSSPCASAGHPPVAGFPCFVADVAVCLEARPQLDFPVKTVPADAVLVSPFSSSSGSFPCFHLAGLAGRDRPGASGRIGDARRTAWGATLLARTDRCPSPQHERRLGVRGHLGLHSHEHRRALHGLRCGVGPDGAIRGHLCVLVEP